MYVRACACASRRFVSSRRLSSLADALTSFDNATVPNMPTPQPHLRGTLPHLHRTLPHLRTTLPRLRGPCHLANRRAAGLMDSWRCRERWATGRAAICIQPPAACNKAEMRRAACGHATSSRRCMWLPSCAALSGYKCNPDLPLCDQVPLCNPVAAHRQHSCNTQTTQLQPRPAAARPGASVHPACYTLQPTQRALQLASRTLHRTSRTSVPRRK